MPEFKHGDVVTNGPRGFVGIVTTERESPDGKTAAVMAWRMLDGTDWCTHARGHAGCEVWLYDDPDTIWAEYTQASLLGQVRDITYG